MERTTMAQPADWIPGNQLRAADKVYALHAFTHRRVGMLTDTEWLASHLFAIRRDGGMDRRVKVCKLGGRS